jgi:hypothetical protein
VPTRIRRIRDDRTWYNPVSGDILAGRRSLLFHAIVANTHPGGGKQRCQEPKYANCSEKRFLTPLLFPECRGFTIVRARKCFHCGSDLTLPTTAAPNPRPQQPVQQKPPSAEEEEAAAVAFAQAQDCINTGQSQLAGEILKDIVKRFPKTQAALKAQRCPEYPS